MFKGHLQRFLKFCYFGRFWIKKRNPKKFLKNSSCFQDRDLQNQKYGTGIFSDFVVFQKKLLGDDAEATGFDARYDVYYEHSVQP